MANNATSATTAKILAEISAALSAALSAIVGFIFPATPGSIRLHRYSPADFARKAPRISLIVSDQTSGQTSGQISGQNQNAETYATYACFPYRHELIKILVWEIKDGKNAHAADLAAHAVSEVAIRALRDSSMSIAVLPIPTTYMKHCDRGYNQCELIADAMARADPSKFFVLKKALSCKHWFREPDQKSKQRKDRLAGADDRFVLKAGALAHLPPGTPIVIVDDVTTTGATLTTAIGTVKKALRDIPREAGSTERSVVIGVAVAH